MASRKLAWLALLLALVSGVVSYVGFKPQGWWFASLIGVTGLYLALRPFKLPGAFLAGVIFGLGQFLPMLTWAHNAAGLLPYLALALVSALFLALGPLAYATARPLVREAMGDSPWADAAVFAVTVTAADALRSFVPYGGFPWGRLAFSQVAGPLAAWAWLGGTALVGLVAAAAGPLVVAAGRAVWSRRFLGAVIGAGLAAGLLLAPLALPLASGAESGAIRVGAVQGDVTVTQEGLFAQQREVLSNHARLTARMMADPATGRLDVVLWPENSTDIDPRTDAEAEEVINAAAAAAGAPLLVGAAEYLPTGQRYNQGLLWVADQGIVDQYAKQHPAPFAEYMPARSFFRFFTSKVDLISSDMLPGEEVGVMALDAPRLGREVALGDIICFEVAYDAIVAETVREGAEFVVVQTNNASFGHSEEATQQFAMTRLRAIELGRATVQISTVGVSAAVAPDGSLMTPLTNLFEPAYFVVDLPLRTSLTPAALAGQWVTGLILLLGAALALAGIGAWAITRR
ncbi:MAG: apolipoprotein N-acyltransferase [Bifidobacteriaceae bacterium]|jgi:apolipoprotein N-acyltransferase|nr:apolipoprotein N-acyltransferase [Bifidobacteriaceae bacterium]